MPTDPAQTHVGPQWKHARPLTACKFDPMGKFVFTGAEDNFVTRWDVASGAATQLAAHDSWIRALAVSADGQTLISGGYDGRIIWWPAAAEKPTPARTIDAHQGWVRAIVLSPNGQQLASCGNDNLVKIWNVADGALVVELTGHASHVYNVAFHPDGNSLVSCDLKGVVKQWSLAPNNTDEKKMSREFTAAALHKYDDTFRADIGGARSLAFSRDGKQLAVAGVTNVSNAFAGIGNPAIVLLNMEDGKPIVQYASQEKVQAVMWGVRHSPDGYWIGLAGGAVGGVLYFWRDAAADQFFKFQLPDSGRDLDLSPDGTKVAVAHSDNHLRLYNLFAKG